MSQPDPIPNSHRSIHDIVIDDIKGVFSLATEKAVVRTALAERKEKGLQTYGTILQPHNGRDALQDCFEELLDAACYACQACLENPENLLYRQLYNKTLQLCLHAAGAKL